MKLFTFKFIFYITLLILFFDCSNKNAQIKDMMNDDYFANIINDNLNAEGQRNILNNGAPPIAFQNINNVFLNVNLK